MKNIDTGSLVVRKYEHGGKQGRFVMCRRTGARCLLEGTAATFFFGKLAAGVRRQLVSLWQGGGRA